MGDSLSQIAQCPQEKPAAQIQSLKGRQRICCEIFSASILEGRISNRQRMVNHLDFDSCFLVDCGTLARPRLSWDMFDMVTEIDLLERCASECELIARLATDERARFENERLALDYRQIAEVLRSTA
jgi:hypothetical protein